MLFNQIYFKTSFYLIAERIIALISGLFLGIMVADYLEPEIYGRYSYIVSWFGIFLAISKIGMEDIMIREISKNLLMAKKMIGVGFWIRVFSGLLAILFSTIITILYSDDKEISFLIIILSLSLVLDAFSVSKAYFLATSNSKTVSLINLVGTLFLALAKFLCILFELSLSEFIYILFCESLIKAIGYIILTKTYFGLDYLLGFDRKLALQWIKNSIPLLLASLSTILYMKADQIMILHYLDSSALGNYSMAVRFCESVNFLPIILSAVLYPSLIESNLLKRNSNTQRLFSIITLTALFAMILVLCFAKFLTLHMLQDFTDFYGVLLINIWSIWFVFIGVASTKRLMVDNYEWIQMSRTALGLIVNVILNIYWIPNYGITGAAYATLISYFVASLLSDLLSPKTRLHFLLKIKSLYLSEILNSKNKFK